MRGHSRYYQILVQFLGKLGDVLIFASLRPRVKFKTMLWAVVYSLVIWIVHGKSTFSNLLICYVTFLSFLTGFGVKYFL